MKAATKTTKTTTKRAARSTKKAAAKRAGATIAKKAANRRERPPTIAVPEVLKSLRTPVPHTSETVARTFVLEDSGTSDSGIRFASYRAKVRTLSGCPTVDRVNVFTRITGKGFTALAKFYPCEISEEHEVFGCVGDPCTSDNAEKAIRKAVQSALDA